MPLSQILALIGTGLSLGVVHVLTGPDHLSAIATLSANVDYAGAFLLGVRWGIGHSTGLLLVGCIFIALTLGSEDTTVDIPEHVSHAFEGLVGVFMLLLGTYGIRKAWEKRPSLVYQDIQEGREGAGEDLTTEFGDFADEEEALESKPSPEEVVAVMPDAHEADGIVVIDTQRVDESVFVRCMKTLSIRTMATVAGIVHGLAGPGGVLGVIPAVQLHNARLATIYLGSFCASSTLTMGIFAMLYGTCSSRIGRNAHHEFMIESMSASLSILVGLLWLVLLSVGKLDDVFP
uniref:Nickel/cobalt efflux system n=1 Tax=Amphora coffeiformis TaxID=265554 RepID=A0A7S3KZ89_9STRA|mmetsp:Transcript_19527/g.36918  ORF Transcript_19527/g.36918 Transcript_19527/m.36918 type:complete len:290 (+) Transcript_19527:131-1000(+)